MYNKKLGIVIPTFNRKEHLKVVLTNINNQILNLLLEVIVVDDGSTDGTNEMLLNEYKSIHVIRGSGDWWFTKCLNEGCKYAIDTLNVDILLTLNDDIEFQDNFIDILSSDFEKKKGCIIGPMSIDWETRTKITFSGIKKYNKITGGNIPYYRYGTEYDINNFIGIFESYTLPTRGLMFSGSIYKLLNGFDEKFPQYASDNDFVLRAKKKGIKTIITYNTFVLEKTKLTGDGSPKISKEITKFLQNMFLNKYSPTYYPNSLRMVYRHRPKLFFPYYSILSLIGIIKSYYKYQ